MEKKCKNCNKILEIKPCLLKKFKHHFCSVNCFKIFRSKKIELKCINCKKTFLVEPSKQYIKCCSKICFSDFVEKRKIKVKCTNCGRTFSKANWDIDRFKKRGSKRHYCSKVCATIHIKENKLFVSIKRSKLEKWIEKKLTELYSKLKIEYNNRKICGGLELDIYIPELNLAFEINGPFHYEPIFGKERLLSVKKRDKEKIIKCAEKEIDLYILDTSSQRSFDEKTSQKFLENILTIIKKNI